MIPFAQLLSMALRLIAISVLVSAAFSISHSQTSTTNSASATVVTLHWAARRGVSRYRLQLANDAEFTDIVVDRVIAGLEYQVADLPIGKYFWRVGPVGDTFRESSSGVIDIRAAAANTGTAPQQTPTGTPRIVTQGGWYSAIGSSSTPILGHLRSLTREDIVTVAGSRVLALDATNGVELWATRLNTQSRVMPIAVRSATGLDNILIIAASAASMLDGRTGRALWQAKLPAVVSTAQAINGKIFIVDNSLERLFVINSAGGQLLAQAQLPGRAVGTPAPFELNPHSVLLALEDGRVEVIDETGNVLRSGSAGSVATTAPLFVRSARGTFVLVGAKDGLTALNAADLRPLGRINLKGDTPRGALAAVDLDGDRNPEVVMPTERGQVFVVKSDEGRVLWTADAHHADVPAFADVNGDGTLDLLAMSREGSAFALSGRDGTIIWKEETGTMAANHAPASRSRSIVVARTTSGLLLITSDAGGSGLRATAFSSATSH